jgi:NitT/TauT family transport system substrate-binding protein
MRRPKTKKLNFYAAVLVTGIFAGAALWPAMGLADEKLNYRLKWLFNASVVGDLYADVNGAFAERGLAVEVKAGGPERDAIKELELGYADFGVASADQVIRALSKGAMVVVIAQLFQINPLQWIYRADEIKLEHLQDLKGKTIGITYGGNDETIMRTLLAAANLTEDQVRLFSVRYDYTPFYQKKVDIWPVYRNSQAIFVSQKLTDAKEKVGFLNPADYGVTFVANSVVTSRKMIQQHPETVQKFLSAVLKGWREALDPANQAKVIAMLEKVDKDTAPPVIAEQLKITRELVQPGEAAAIGAIDVKGWQQTEQIMLQQKVIPSPVGVDKYLKSSLP